MHFSWLRSKDNRRAQRPALGRRRPAYRPSLEALEERALLAAGALDPTFGNGGLIVTPLNYSASDAANSGFKSLAVQPDGKYLIANVSNGAVPGFNVARFNTDGTLDPTFGTNGIANVHFSANSVDKATAVALQADGTIIVVGTTTDGSGNSDFGVARFTAAGQLDKSFGFNKNGTTVINFTPPAPVPANTLPHWQSTASSLTIEPDGRIVVAGSTAITTAPVLTTLAVNSAVGDRTITVTNIVGAGQSFQIGSGATLESDLVQFSTIGAGGQIQLTLQQPLINAHNAGESLIGPATVDVSVARLNSDGTQDADFDADGRVIANVGATLSKGAFQSTDNLTDVGIEPDGKIVAVGWTNIEQDGKELDLADNFAVARFNPDGTLDKTFQGGLLSLDLATSPYGLTGPSPFKDRAYSIAFQLDGKILISGTSQYQVAGPGGNPPNALNQDNFATIRLNTNGTFDNTFTADGVVITDFSNDFTQGSEDQASQVTIQADGKILVTGFTTTSSTNPGPAPAPNPNNKNFALARYNVDGTLDQTFGFHGKVINDVGFGASDYANQSAILTNGQIFTVGAVGDNPNAKLALARYIGFTPGTIQFSSANYSVSENGGSATITVTRVGGTDGTATVQFSTTSGTAVAGTDFTPVTGTLVFGPGVTTLTFTVNVRDDGVFQSSNKVLNLTLTNLLGGPGFGTPSTATLTLVEADLPGGGINTGGGGGGVLTAAIDKYINHVYLDLLSRPVDAPSLMSWETYLNSGGTRQNFVALVTLSQEYRNDVVQAQYVHYLHRNADPAGLASFSAVLGSGGTDEQVAASLIASTEYFQNRAGGTNDGFVTALFGDVLNRTPAAGERSQYDQMLAGGTTTGQVAGILLTSVEYDTGLVTGWYFKYLHRAPDAAGLAADVNLLQNGTHGAQPIFASDPTGGTHRIKDEDIIIAMLASQEYYILATS